MRMITIRCYLGTRFLPAKEMEMVSQSLWQLDLHPTCGAIWWPLKKKNLLFDTTKTSLYCLFIPYSYIFCFDDAGAFFAMKAVLSYFHAQERSDKELHHVYYLLMLPMLQVLNRYLSK